MTFRGRCIPPSAQHSKSPGMLTGFVLAVWTNLAYPSLRPLGSWLVNLMQRVTQLVEWTTDLGVPKSVWLPGLFNPQSFLTAVMQVSLCYHFLPDITT